MDTTYWHKQGDKPLYEELLWSKPENKRFAGKLLIVGGNAHGFLAPASAFGIAEKTGIGVAKVLLPDVVSKSVGQVLENTEYAPSNKSGSFAKNALEQWLHFASWADGILLAGDFGHNSETAVVIEKFLKMYSGPVIVTQDAIDELYSAPSNLLDRPSTVIVASLGQLQRLCTEIKYKTAIKYEYTLQQMVSLLQQLTAEYKATIIVKHNNIFLVAADGKVSSTHSDSSESIWRVETAATASVWVIQNPSKQFEAATTSIYEVINNQKNQN